MSLNDLLTLLVALFPISETCLGICKSKTQGSKVDDRGSLRLLWLVIAIGVGLALGVRGYEPTQLDGPPRPWELISLALIVVGLAWRWWSIITLGRFFTTDIATHAGQWVVQSGPYRWVRHPSYTGLLTTFIGIGLYLGNWLSVVALVIPTLCAVMHRIRIEEAVLHHSLGIAYSEYCARTKRLIPGVF